MASQANLTLEPELSGRPQRVLVFASLLMLMIPITAAWYYALAFLVFKFAVLIGSLAFG